MGDFWLGSVAGAAFAATVGGLLLAVARGAGRRWAVLLTSLMVATACAAAVILLPPDRPPEVRNFTVFPPPGRPALGPSIVAYTDSGRTIELSSLGEEQLPTAELRADEESFGRKYLFDFIRTVPPAAESNCHGWVFTGGRFYVNYTDVDAILADNSYEAVSEPHVGDLVLYRGPSGEPAHTAVVRVAGDLVLVEGKWGPLGCYLHAPDRCPDLKSWTYYRSARNGHLLRFAGE